MKIYEMDMANSAHLHCTSLRALDKEVEEIMKRFR
mgnify:CR=1 FL=1